MISPIVEVLIIIKSPLVEVTFFLFFFHSCDLFRYPSIKVTIVILQVNNREKYVGECIRVLKI